MTEQKINELKAKLFDLNGTLAELQQKFKVANEEAQEVHKELVALQNPTNGPTEKEEVVEEAKEE